MWKLRNVGMLVLLLSFLSLVPHPGLALETSPKELTEVDASATNPATAPWFLTTVVSGGNVGEHVSIAMHEDRPYVAYYDADDGDLAEENPQQEEVQRADPGRLLCQDAEGPRSRISRA